MINKIYILIGSLIWWVLAFSIHISAQSWVTNSNSFATTCNDYKSTVCWEVWTGVQICWSNVCYGCQGKSCFARQTFPNLCAAKDAGAITYTKWVCISPNPTKEDIIDRSYHKDITSYNTLKTFRYDDVISRQEASKMVMNFAKSIPTYTPFVYFDYPNAASRCVFQDNELFHYSLSTHIYNACRNMIFVWADLDDGSWFKKFYPHHNITKEQLIAVLIRLYYGRLDESGALWSKRYIEKARSLWLSFDTSGEATRGEVIYWMYYLYDHYSMQVPR